MKSSKCRDGWKEALPDKVHVHVHKQGKHIPQHCMLHFKQPSLHKKQ